jgi:hypothetical protein
VKRMGIRSHSDWYIYPSPDLPMVSSILSGTVGAFDPFPRPRLGVDCNDDVMMALSKLTPWGSVGPRLEYDDTLWSAIPFVDKVMPVPFHNHGRNRSRPCRTR